MTLDEFNKRLRLIEDEIHRMVAELEADTEHQFIISKIELERVILINQKKPWLLGVNVVSEG